MPKGRPSLYVRDGMVYLVEKETSYMKARIIRALGTAALASVISVSCSDPNVPSGTITLRAKDGVPVTIDVYAPHPDKATFVVLCHRANWSRGEYSELAPWLNSLGINCIAVDQRSGGKINGVDNKTLLEALKRSKDTGYPSAEADIVAALEYANKRAKGTVVLWGSSYSSALAIVIAAKRPDLVDAIVSVSPGEYFAEYGLSRDWVKEHAARLSVPALVMAPAEERTQALSIYDAIPEGNKRVFVPKTGGRHGSEALWQKTPGHGDFRAAAGEFLESLGK